MMVYNRAACLLGKALIISKDLRNKSKMCG